MGENLTDRLKQTTWDESKLSGLSKEVRPYDRHAVQGRQMRLNVEHV